MMSKFTTILLLLSFILYISAQFDRLRGPSGFNRDGGNGGRGNWGQNDDNDNGFDNGFNGGEGFGGRGRNGNGGGRGGGGGRNGDGMRGRGGNRGGNGQGNGRGGQKPDTPSPNGPNPHSSPVPGNLISMLTPVHRYYRNQNNRHRYQTDSNIISQWQKEGYFHELIIGKVLRLDSYNTAIKICPKLRELRSLRLPSTDTQYLSASPEEALAKTKSGWIRMESLGYCVTEQACGATKPLYAIDSNYNDLLYTTNLEEYQNLNRNAPEFKGRGDGVLCWIFPWP